MWITRSDESNAISLFEIIGKYFPLLTHLSITCDYIRDRIENLKTCKALTYFEIFCDDLCDDTLKDIHIHLPQLQKINISSKHYSEVCHITNVTLNNLSLMKNIRELSICYDYISESSHSFNDNDICPIINKCDSLQVLTLPDANITRTTIDAFIEKAKLHPKKVFNFYYDSDFKFECNDLPPNFILKRFDARTLYTLLTLMMCKQT